MNIRKATPILVVDAITPETVAFWEKTGWKKVVDVPHAGSIGFVLFAQLEREVMLQTKASVNEDLGLPDLQPAFALYLDVENLAEARAECEKAGGRIRIRERKTFYGALECWATDPAGNLLGYAQVKG
jgi:predicted enzyme related to lactoylglutathione lyase